MRQGRARAAVSDAFVSMGSVVLSVCGKDVLASCSDDPMRKNIYQACSIRFVSCQALLAAYTNQTVPR